MASMNSKGFEFHILDSSSLLSHDQSQITSKIGGDYANNHDQNPNEKNIKQSDSFGFDPMQYLSFDNLDGGNDNDKIEDDHLYNSQDLNWGSVLGHQQHNDNYSLPYNCPNIQSTNNSLNQIPSHGLDDYEYLNRKESSLTLPSLSPGNIFIEHNNEREVFVDHTRLDLQIDRILYALYFICIYMFLFIVVKFIFFPSF